MQQFINWGEESPDQIEQRRRFEEDLREFAINRMVLEARLSAAQAAVSGFGGKALDNLSGSGTITFDGVSQYVSAPNAQVVNWLPGTGDFTIEWFAKKTAGGSSFPRLFSLGYDTGATIGCSVEGGTCYIWPYGNDLKGSMPAGYNGGTAWTHIAICRSGTTTKLFIDGTLKATKTGDSRSIDDSINPGFDLNMGVDNPAGGSPNWWSGKMTNFRWVNSALYTGSSLTVPTQPLTKVASTKLLMLGGTVADPARDSAGLNTLVNHGGVWSDDTPFVA